MSKLEDARLDIVNWLRALRVVRNTVMVVCEHQNVLLVCHKLLLCV